MMVAPAKPFQATDRNVVLHHFLRQASSRSRAYLTEPTGRRVVNGGNWFLHETEQVGRSYLTRSSGWRATVVAGTYRSPGQLNHDHWDHCNPWQN